MEAAAVAYEAASTVVQGALAAAKGLTMPTAPLRAKFQQLKAPSLPRSSHSLNVVGGKAYVFGGEIAPRQPVDNAMHVITLPSSELQEADYVSVPAKASAAATDVPPPRVGHAAATIGNSIFIFGGRGGQDMTALEEQGRVWVFETTTKTWSSLDPAPGHPFPPARSYHSATASDHPLPTPHPNVTNILVDEAPDAPGKQIPGPLAAATYGTFFVHAGCLSSGGRTSDLWAFDVSARSWAQLPSAPGPARGGTSLTIVNNRLYRFGGFDGQKELGGAVDHLDLVRGTFDDKGGKGEMALSASPKGWYANAFSVGIDNHGGPADRSVCGLVPVSTGQGRHYLLIVGGETSPSNQGHSGAGKFLDDAWAFQLKPEGGTAAAVKDATRGVLMGKDTGEAQVSQVKYFNSEGVLVQEGQKKPMCGRGWFAASTAGDIGGPNTVMIWGGVDESNERLGDGWIITLE